MRKVLVIILISFIQTSYAMHTIEDVPHLKVIDAIGVKKFSIKNFCLTEDDKTFIGNLRVCVNAKHVGRGYKKCTLKRKKVIKLSNSFEYSYRLGRVNVRTSNYKYERDILINVYEFDPRGGRGEVVETYNYSIPTCKSL